MKTINQGSIDFLKYGKGRDTCGGYLPNRWFEAGVFLLNHGLILMTKSLNIICP